MPVILATQETKIRKIQVLGQPQKKKKMRPYLKNTQHKKGLVE
jgi:hypothetical protein